MHFDEKDYTEDDWKLLEALRKLADRGRNDPSLGINRYTPSRQLQLFKHGKDGSVRNLVVFHQQSNQTGDDLSRSCSMSFDNVSEIVGLFEVFFKL